MLDRVLSEAGLWTALEKLAAERRIVGPVRRGDRFFYEEVRGVRNLDLTFNYCTYSPKSFLLPATETLFSFDREKHGFVARPVLDRRPTALIGVHPCDIHAIRLLDRVFTQDHHDEHYLTRRENMFIVGIDCASPCTDGVFCADMRCNRADEGFDVMLYPLADRFGVVFGTDAGREWMQSTDSADAPGEQDQQEFESYQSNKAAGFPRMLRTPAGELPGLMDRSYDSLVWEAMARRCYSCGSCNTACPTCYCFNICDDLDFDQRHGERRREWDGCMLRDFSLVAGGHNFRSKTPQRLRHRIYRKISWIEKRTGLSGCTGCGRCDRACTAKISIVEILNQLAEEKAHVS